MSSTLAALKDAARLLVYFVAVVMIGALLAPPLYWAGQWFLAHGSLTFLSKVDFESYFHRALLIAAIALFWPLLRSSSVRSMRDLGLERNPNRVRDTIAGFALAAIPLLCCGAAVVAMHVYALRATVKPAGLLQVAGSTVFVPIVEELFFRGLVLGILLRSGYKYLAMFLTAAIYSIVHFLKAPEQTSPVVTWTSGLNSIAHSLAQFADPMLVAASFTTLFLLGWIMADARVQTRSLWLSGGLHAGWIFSAGIFNKIARRQMIALPWLGKNLLVGIVPLAVALLTWLLVRLWLNYAGSRKV